MRHSQHYSTLKRALQLPDERNSLHPQQRRSGPRLPLRGNRGRVLQNHDHRTGARIHLRVDLEMLSPHLAEEVAVRLQHHDPLL